MVEWVLRITDSDVAALRGVTSHDDITAMFTEFDFVHRGAKDRTYVTVGLDVGIPELFGSQSDSSPDFSRTNAEAGFEKISWNL